MKQFHICTIANNKEQYKNLLESLHLSGFSNENSTISLFDNFDKNQFEPFSSINEALRQTTEPYVLFCHQDILFNKGDGFKNLVARLKELNELDPKWSVAGNAGVNERFKYVIKISDANNSYNWTGSFPQKVFSLDENFLVINMKNKPKCSPELTGFHLYGSDICLNAIKNGNTNYVINFHLTHLSGGNTGREFMDCLEKFRKKWAEEFNFCYHKTITGKETCFSRYKLLKKFGLYKLLKKPILFINRYYTFAVPHIKS
jgi:hypothetical protein